MHMSKFKLGTVKINSSTIGTLALQADGLAVIGEGNINVCRQTSCKIGIPLLA